MRFIRGHALVNFVSLVDVSSDGLHIHLALVRAALVEVDWRYAFSSHMFTPALWRGWNLPIWLLLFTRYYKPWVFACAGFSDLSDLDIHLRYPLPSWGSFGWSMYLAFLEGVPKFSEKFPNRSRAIYIVCPVQSPRGYLILSPGLWPSVRLSGVASVGSWLLLSSLW